MFIFIEWWNLKICSNLEKKHEKSSDRKKPVEKQRKTNLKTKKNSRVHEYTFLETYEYFCLICEHFLTHE
jgi:hypothetical protein